MCSIFFNQLQPRGSDSELSDVDADTYDERPDQDGEAHNMPTKDYDSGSDIGDK